MRVVVIISIVAIVALSAGFLWKANTKDIATNERIAEPVRAEGALAQSFIEVPAVTYHETKDSVPSLRYTYTLSVPRIALAGHVSHAKATNDVINTFARDLLDSFRKELEPDETDLAMLGTSDFTLGSTPLLLSPTIIAFRFDSASYISGSAHPNQRTHIFLYDIEEGHTLGLDDIFSSSTLALPVLSEYTRGVLRERWKDANTEEYETMTLQGTEPVADNFRAIAPTTDGLVIVFDPYQVASYARGTQEVRVPLSEINHLFTPRLSEAIRLAGTNVSVATPE